jgi:hypothetical protein
MATELKPDPCAIKAIQFLSLEFEARSQYFWTVLCCVIYVLSGSVLFFHIMS